MTQPLLLLLLLAPGARADDPPPWEVVPDSTLALSTDAGASFAPLGFVEAAEWGPPVGGTYSAFYPPALDSDLVSGGLGCDPLPALPPGAAPAAYVLSRGRCTFATKAQNALAAGAAVVLVYDSPVGAYWAAQNASLPFNASALAAAPCFYDCAAGAGSVGDAEASNLTAALGGFPGRCDGGGSGACASGMCLLTGQPQPQQPGGGGGGQQQVCCMVQAFVPMPADSTAAAAALASFPGAFAPAAAGARVMAALTAVGRRRQAPLPGGADPTAVQPVALALGTRPTPAVDPSYMLMVLLGWGVAAAASFYAGWPERAAMRLLARGAAPPPLPAATAGGGGGGEEITLAAVPCLLATVVCVLGGLWVLLRQGVPITYLVLALFAAGAASAVAEVVVRPLLGVVDPRAEGISLACAAKWGVRTTAAGAAAQAVGWAAAGTFVLARHAPWAWALQDALAVLLCCAALSSVRISSLRTATATLGAFLAFDVAAVLLSPLLVGSSVMVDVATAGAPAAYPGGDQACYCRAHPGDSTFCGPTEYMPILLRLPLAVDYRGGFVMLGLGDIILPGIALAICLRQDYYAKRAVPSGAGALARVGLGCAATGRGVGYFPVAVGGYGLGLALANAAVVALRLGQPALLYLVPCVLVPVVGLAAARGELAGWWAPREDVDLEGDDGVAAAGGSEGGTELGVLTSARRAVAGLLAPAAVRSAAQARSNSLLAGEFDARAHHHSGSGGDDGGGPRAARADSDDSLAGDTQPLRPGRGP